ncbi:MAG: DUF4349 domain-containing protein [Myxococcales bacterium]|nr:DUF4349 domain-containing protein [Myxococcales bacterium]
MRTLLLALAALALAGCGAAAQRSMPAPAVANSPTLPESRILIRTARLTVEVNDEKDFDPTLDRIEAITGDLKGYVSSRRRDAIDVRIPAPQLDTALGQISGLGEVTYRDVRVQDVTAEALDLDVRIENLKTLRTRLQALVEKADQVADLMALEKELARVTADLESLEARQRVIQRDVAYSAVSVSLEEDISPGPLGWIPYGLYLGVKWLLVWD